MPPVEALPTLEQLCEPGENGRFPMLLDLCEQLGAYVAAASNEISARYFSHANSLAEQVAP